MFIRRRTVDKSLSMQLVKEITGKQYFAVLNSVDDGIPYSNLVSFSITDNLKSLVFVTDRNTRKYRNIRHNARVSLLIDNRTNQPSDISEAVAITVIGNAGEEPDKKSGLRSVFLARHPHLENFVDDPGNALIQITVTEYIIAGFDRTERIVIPP